MPTPCCPVCGGTGARTLHTDLSDRVFGLAPGTWTLKACGECGTARLDPRPSDEAIPALYGDYYTHAAPSLTQPPGTRARRVVRAMRNDHLNARLGYRLAPACPVGRLAGRLAPPLGAVAERAVANLPAGDRLLDVGCGNGEFVAAAVAAGWRATGIDVDPAAVAQGRAVGLDLAVETIDAHAAREPDRYDALTLSHVVEHVPDPVVFLRTARRLIRPGGHLWVATPNLMATGHRLFGAHWMALDPPRHLVLFDAASLTRALSEAGFGRVRVMRPVPSAGIVFRVSDAIRAGARRAYDTGPAPLRVRARALLADIGAQREWSRAEELVVLARRS